MFEKMKINEKEAEDGLFLRIECEISLIESTNPVPKRCQAFAFDFSIWAKIIVHFWY